MRYDSPDFSADPIEQAAEKKAWHAVRAARRVVVKIGSSLLTDDNDHRTLRRAWIAERCREVASLMREGRQVMVVTSGAIAAGLSRLGLDESRRASLRLREKQAAAAAGQSVLMRCYEEALAMHGFHAAQVLLTRDDMIHRRRYLNARDTLETLLTLGVVPIINENDTVMVTEIQFGDNDTLAALVAGLVNADLLILLSDVEGLFETDPKHNVEATLVTWVREITPALEQLGGGVGSAVGSGGMVTKLRAAKKAARSGCQTILLNGFQENPILRVFRENPVGTLFASEGDPINSRKRWIANGLTSEGVLDLDAGAVTALRCGNSLLAKGIVGVEGRFDRGAAVYCRTPEGRNIAKGLIGYTADQVRLLAGHHSDHFQELLGFLGDREMIHRDSMVMLDA